MDNKKELLNKVEQELYKFQAQGKNQELTHTNELHKTSYECPECKEPIYGVSTLEAMSGRLIIKCKCGYCNVSGRA